MVSLSWMVNDRFNVNAPSCGCCGKGKVRWYPCLAGWPVRSGGLEDRFGLCSGCRDEWERIWKRKGKA